MDHGVGTHGWIALATAIAVLVALARGLAADLTMGAALALLLALGVVTPAEALRGFASEATLSVAALLIIAEGIRETGGLDFLLRYALGHPRSLPAALVRLLGPSMTASAFLNNTALVAMLMPVVTDWSKRIGRPASKILIPLNHAILLGGTCTLIGTSSNLVVAGMLHEKRPDVVLGLFDLSVVGVPVAIAGFVYLVLSARWLLPDTTRATDSMSDVRKYTVAMRVESGSPIVGSTIETAGLRHLPGLFLIEIQREGEAMVAVSPSRTLHADDVLVFAGLVDSVVDLRRIRGLVPATDQVAKVTRSNHQRRLVEAVVAAQSSLAGVSVRESAFRTHYNAAIIAVHRYGEHIVSKIGDITLEAGDVLLLETRPNFVEAHRHAPEFALVREVEGSAPPRYERAGVGLAIVAALVVANVLAVLPLVTTTLLAVGAMLVTRCLTGDEVRRALHLPTLITMACSFAVGAALDSTGVAAWIAKGLVAASLPMGTPAVVLALYGVTALITQIITNNAAAALMFPIVYAAAERAGIDLRFAMVVLMLGASASFSTPIGYQTNLMIAGPGGYRFRDFLRMGLPLQVLAGVIIVAVASALLP